MGDLGDDVEPSVIVNLEAQGAVLSPTLFNVMINDLFNGCLGNVEMSLYADDGALWIVGQDIDNCG